MGTDRRDMDEGLRSHPAGKHVIYYRETKRHLVIVRVLHQNMEPERHSRFGTGGPSVAVLDRTATAPPMIRMQLEY